MDVEVAKGIEIEPSTVIKRGEIVTNVILHRSTKGLTLQVKAHSGVEEFARSLGTGEAGEVKLSGRYWTQVGETPLRVYDASLLRMEHIRSEDGTTFRLDRPGHPLYDENGCLNMSFLRLVGISDGAGITFGIGGVYTLEALRKLRDQISGAAKKYYIHFLKPVDLSVMVSTTELNV